MSPERDQAAVARLIDRIGHALNGAGYAAGLNPAQWAALRYFAGANRFSRTTTGFARYHASSVGTASQTIKVLVEKGLLVRGADGRDRRRHHLVPSAAGRVLLEHDPLAQVEQAAGGLTGACRHAVEQGLAAVLDALEHGPAFGVCGECRHLCRDEAGAGARYRCVLADERLEVHETAQICVNFSH